MNKLIFFLPVIIPLAYALEIANPAPPLYITMRWTPNNNQRSVSDIVNIDEYQQHLEDIMDLVTAIGYDFMEEKYYIEFIYR